MSRAISDTTHVATAPLGRRLLNSSVPRLFAALAMVSVIGLLAGGNGFWIRVATMAAITYVLTGSYNLIFGYAGLFSLAHVALYGISGYASVILINEAGLPFLLAAACSVVLTCIVSLGLWVITQRLNDVFFALATLAFGIAVTEVISNWISLTGGPQGYLGIGPMSVGGWTLFGGSVEYMWLCLLLAALSFEILYRASHSPMGHLFIALRGEDTLLKSIAVRPEIVRRNAFLVSALFGGLAGVLYAHMTMFISPESFSLHVMVTVLIITLVGGAGTTTGPIVAVAVFVLIDEVGHRLGDASELLLGSMIVIMIAVAPVGLVGLVQQWLRNRRPAPSVSEAPEESAATQVRKASVPVGMSGPQPVKAHRSLEVRDVTLRFGGVAALQDVGFSVHSGESVGLIGPNGAGKTSLVNVITGFTTAQKGEVLLDGQQLVGCRPEAVAGAGVARTFQSTRLVPSLDLLTNVALAQYRNNPSGGLVDSLMLPSTRRDVRLARSHAAALLELVGIRDEQSALAGELSYGVLRRAEVAKAMALDPAFILLDEPGAGLSRFEHAEVAAAIEAVVARGVGCLLIDHNMSFVASVCSRAVVLVAGAVLAEGTTTEVMQRPEVIEAYLGKVAG
jgi:branched-chain amino acid transport system permease protein